MFGFYNPQYKSQYKCLEYIKNKKTHQQTADEFLGFIIRN